MASSISVGATAAAAAAAATHGFLTQITRTSSIENSVTYWCSVKGCDLLYYRQNDRRIPVFTLPLGRLGKSGILLCDRRGDGGEEAFALVHDGSECELLFVGESVSDSDRWLGVFRKCMGCLTQEIKDGGRAPGMKEIVLRAGGKATGGTNAEVGSGQQGIKSDDDEEGVKLERIGNMKIEETKKQKGGVVVDGNRHGASAELMDALSCVAVLRSAQLLSYYELGKELDGLDDECEEDSSSDEDEDEELPFNFGGWVEGDSLAPFQTSAQCDVSLMLRLAGVGPSDSVYDLGCGDGRVVISAARDFGAKCGVGVELDDIVADKARARLAKEPAEVKARVQIVTGDARELEWTGREALDKDRDPVHSAGTEKGIRQQQRHDSCGKEKTASENDDITSGSKYGDGKKGGTRDAATNKDFITETGNALLPRPTVVIAFLLPEGMAALNETLEEVLRGGGRVVAQNWGMGKLRPMQILSRRNMTFMLYLNASLNRGRRA